MLEVDTELAVFKITTTASASDDTLGKTVYATLSAFNTQLSLGDRKKYTDDLARGVFIPNHCITKASKPLGFNDDLMPFFIADNTLEQIKQQFAANNFPFALFLIHPSKRKDYFITHFKNCFTTNLKIDILHWLPLEMRISFLQDVGCESTPIETLHDVEALVERNPSKKSFDIFVKKFPSAIGDCDFFPIVTRLLSNNTDAVFNEDMIGHIFDYYNQYHQRKLREYLEDHWQVRDLMDAIPENRRDFFYTHKKVNVFFKNILDDKVIMMDCYHNPLAKILRLISIEGFDNPFASRENKSYHADFHKMTCVQEMLQALWGKINEMLTMPDAEFPYLDFLELIRQIIICYPSHALDLMLTNEFIKKIFEKYKSQHYYGYRKIIEAMLRSVPEAKRMALFHQMRGNGVFFNMLTVVNLLEHFSADDRVLFLETCKNALTQDMESGYLSLLYQAINTHLNEVQQLKFYFYLYDAVGIKAINTINIHSPDLKMPSIMRNYFACVSYLEKSQNRADRTQIHSPYFYLLITDSNVFSYTYLLGYEERKFIYARVTALSRAQTTSQPTISQDAAVEEFIQLAAELEKEIKQPVNPQPSSISWSFFSIFSSAPSTEVILIQKIARLRYLHQTLIPTNTTAKKTITAPWNNP